METLSDEIWDVVIAGTSIPQSLLALSLSRSGKKVLHVDRHDYYGGDDAGLSIQDAEHWVEDLQESPSTVFNDASISNHNSGGVAGENTSSLGPSRAYTLSLNPQVVFAQSEFLPTLVSSRIHSQLEFLAVGSWWVHRDSALHKIPSTREDVFNDESLSMKDKRGLMKFLRYVLQDEGEPTTASEEDSQLSLEEALQTRFKVPESLRIPLVALALSPVAANAISFDKAVGRIRRHMRSMGYFGQGFGAVIAKYGGNSEISQVACRAGAVGGGVYLLGHELKSLADTESVSSAAKNSDDEPSLVESTLSDGTQIRSRYIVGNVDDIPTLQSSVLGQTKSRRTWRSINIVANPLRSLFPPTSDGGPTPAVAIVLVDEGAAESEQSPVYLQVHSEDTGECPAGQCIIYASVADGDASAKARLQSAVNSFLETSDASQSLLWSLSYIHSGPDQEPASSYPPLQKHSPEVLVFPSQPHDLAFHDCIMKAVQEAWEIILGEEAANSSFLRFEERESEVED